MRSDASETEEPSSPVWTIAAMRRSSSGLLPPPASLPWPMKAERSKTSFDTPSSASPGEELSMPRTGLPVPL